MTQLIHDGIYHFARQVGEQHLFYCLLCGVFVVRASESASVEKQHLQTMDLQDTLKEFVMTHHQSQDVAQRRREASAAKKAATTQVMAWASELAAVKAAMAGSAEVIRVHVNSKYTLTLKAGGGFKEGSAVSDAVLSAAMEGVTEADLREAAEFLLAKGSGGSGDAFGGSAGDSGDASGVTVKQVIAHAVLRAVARQKAPSDVTVTYRLTVKVGAPTAKSPVVETISCAPDAITAALERITTPDPLAPQAKELAAKEADLSAMLQGSLQGADQPTYSQPLIINMADDVRQSYLLRNSTRTTKPTLTGQRLHEFFSATQHAQLDVRVTATTLDTAGMKGLAQRLAPNILAAIRAWQAQHSQVVSRLRIKAKP